MLDFDYNILQCPIKKENLKYLPKEHTIEFLKGYNNDLINVDEISEGFINESHSYFYPVFNGIILLLPIYAFPINSDGNDMAHMSFDKDRVFRYYNEINYISKNSYKIYEDSKKWVDFREVSEDYIKSSFCKAKRYLNASGKYLLDIASGPIGLTEYINLSENFEYRICADISVNALIQAKQNYKHRKGIYICADITNIPLKDNCCDSVLCQHTLYHVPKSEQKTAVNEMYRVAKPSSRIVIIYSLFYHSWFMNLSLFPVQVYRILRHFAGKFYVRLFNKKPRLYFYPHSLRWFKKSFKFSDKIEIYCWRSTNKYFLNLYIHKFFGGKQLLNILKRSEEKHSTIWGRLGEYPLIQITK
ncbi:MAG: hypothetical protein A2W99_10535 [Bacteroidetes bacterium GWF2_33_16]|nr:MAG: hypothetical protein A2X00_05205 [Bacteroidetes bacterium GWE2_32_14]OFY03979.1 MAG: hypothetical protein A2W99_10535 [Bacteroidetes bacterium GWF2_33_16]